MTCLLSFISLVMPDILLDRNDVVAKAIITFKELNSLGR